MNGGTLAQNRWYASVFYDLGGLDAGANGPLRWSNQ